MSIFITKLLVPSEILFVYDTNDQWQSRLIYLLQEPKYILFYFTWYLPQEIFPLTWLSLTGLSTTM